MKADSSDEEQQWVVQSKRSQNCPIKKNEERNQGTASKKLLQENSSDEQILDELDTGDSLYKVPLEEMNEDLHRHIGALLFKAKSFPGSLFKGTGLLISPDLVLTCSHNILKKETREENYDFRFYPGQCGVLNANGDIKLKEYSILLNTNIDLIQ